MRQIDCAQDVVSTASGADDRATKSVTTEVAILSALSSEMVGAVEIGVVDGGAVEIDVILAPPVPTITTDFPAGECAISSDDPRQIVAHASIRQIPTPIAHAHAFTFPRSWLAAQA